MDGRKRYNPSSLLPAVIDINKHLIRRERLVGCICLLSRKSPKINSSNKSRIYMYSPRYPVVLVIRNYNVSR